MKKEEIIALFEQAVGQALNEEKLASMVNPVVIKVLEGMPGGMVKTLPDTEDRIDKGKMTFSQWLGDVNRLGQGKAPQHGEVGKEFLHLDKSLYTSSDAAGGYLVPTEERRELLDLTSNWEVVPPLCQQVPMRTNAITFPTLTGGLTAYWIPEATSSSPSGQAQGVKQESSPTFGQMTITTHVLAILVYVSNQLLDDSDPSVDRVLYNIFAKTLGSYFDLACLSGAGSATDPVTGLDNLISTNTRAAGSVFNFSDIVDMIWDVYAQALSPAANTRVDVIGHPLAEKNLMKVTDETGAYIYKRPTEAGRVPTLWGSPFRMNRNVSITLGGEGNATKLYCGDFANYAYVGNSMNLTIKANPWMASAFTGNMTAFLAEFRRGFQVSQEAMFSELTGVPTT